MLVNAQIGYEWDNYKVWLQANNLLDEKYIANLISVPGARIPSGQVDIGTPRQVSISIQASF